MKKYDVVVLGGGTGGYVAAIRASQKGKTVAVIEKDKLGGTCLHRGCIPSKALLRTAEVFTTFKNAASFGVEVSGNIAVNFQKAQKRKEMIVRQLEAGIKGLMAKGKIDVYEGTGFFHSNSILKITDRAGKETSIEAKNTIIATGSKPRSLPGLTLDEKQVLSSDGALSLKELPKSIIIIGGGVIGMEWASLLNDFGVKVTVLEYSPRIVPTEDEDISQELQKIYTKKKVQIVTNALVDAKSCRLTEKGVQISAEVNGKKDIFSAEKLLVSVGRSPVVEGIGLENTAIKLVKGAIVVDENCRTHDHKIFAIGDCIPTLQLAHVAMHEGILAVDTIVGEETYLIPYEQIPRCIYTAPEIASVGISEATAKERGYEVKVGYFPFQAIGKALVHGEKEGFTKIIADKNTDDILGITIIGPHATDLIGEAALGQMLEATPWEIAHTVHAHPTLSEVLGEAALAVDGLSLHM
ncbi:dihydrolipoyl dehydrogenase [Niallia circulans]|uniref:Dihydrolipoyl dehydrogenase n=1 Tax=Niallia circulans TaxID=1397 RepID=A0AA91TW82_NIACI|nr:dihydrolipoyl dehydrogenase [Niallia circulans]PAD85215.1 dihydrolipoyl dehydrogenase [Niallia circulans]